MERAGEGAWQTVSLSCCEEKHQRGTGTLEPWYWKSTITFPTVRGPELSAGSLASLIWSGKSSYNLGAVESWVVWLGSPEFLVSSSSLMALDADGRPRLTEPLPQFRTEV